MIEKALGKCFIFNFRILILNFLREIKLKRNLNTYIGLANI